MSPELLQFFYTVGLAVFAAGGAYAAVRERLRALEHRVKQLEFRLNNF